MTENITADANFEGLRGWLILVGLGVVLSPLIMAITILPTYSHIFSSGLWSAVATQTSKAYNPAFAALLIVELTVNCALIVAWVFAAYLFFSKKKAFPKVFIGIVAFSLLFIIVDVCTVKALLPTVHIFDSNTMGQFVRSLIVALIWIPYMLISRRVQATFVR